MKAVVQDRYGSPDVLQLQEIERPAIGDEQVLVRVRAASINAYDRFLVRGRPFLIRLMAGGVRKPKTRVRGLDLAGTVEAVGGAVTRFHPGDEVFGQGEGAFAEFARSAEKDLGAKPSRLTFEQAAALPMAGLTALLGLRDKGRITPGQKVLVNGAGGGVGTFAVQIAKALGGHVTAVTSTAKVELVRSLGADEVIDYTREDFALRPERYDLVFDISGNRSFRDCRRILRPNGKIVVVGGGNGTKKSAPIGRIVKASMLKRLLHAPLVICDARPRQEDIVDLSELVGAGKVSPVVDREYSLSEVPQAIGYLETGEASGKVVIAVS